MKHKDAFIDTKYLCWSCTSDNYLSRQIKKSSHAAQCAGCSKKRKSIPLNELADRIKDVLDEHFSKCDSWQHGQDLNSVIQEVASVEPEVADLIIPFLLPSEGEKYEALKDGDELFIEENATYEENSVETGEFDYLWDSFCFNVKHSARFFSMTAEARLEELLAGIERLRTWGDHGSPCVRIISPGDKESTVFRARGAFDNATRVRILRSPAGEMGPPPRKMAVARRMNPAGVSVFYGSFDAETCLAEIRLPVGGTAFTASFRLVKPVTVLDLPLLSEAVHEVSWFDPSFEHACKQLAFLRRFHEEVSRPVLEIDEVLDYIPTQVVAEYLGQKFKPQIDGVLYKSAQAGGSGLNIALFHHASGLDGIEPTLAPISAEAIALESDRLVIRSQTKKEDDDQNEESVCFSGYDPGFESELLDPSTQPDVEILKTLELVKESLEFWRISGIELQADKLGIVDLREK